MVSFIDYVPMVNSELYINNNQNNIFRSVRYAYDPVKLTETSAPHFKQFPFFEYTETQNSLLLDPQSMHIPWPTTFSGCRQSKHWANVERAVRRFLVIIRTVGAENHEKVPNEALSMKEQELIETAVLCSIYMFPEGSSKRAELIGALLLMAFLHDDIIEFHPEKGATMIDDVIASWPETLLGIDTPRLVKSAAFAKLANEVLEEDMLLGEELLKGLILWVQHTHSYGEGTKPVFESLKDYLLYRFKDVGIEFIVGLVKFGYNARMTASDTYILSNFIRLWHCHISLVNDLYSFDKEKREAQTKEAILVNAVDVLEKSLSLSTEEAKKISRNIVWDLERDMHEECISLCRAGGLTDGQCKLIRGLLECAAGNVFYSAVQRRYGGDSATLL